MNGSTVLILVFALLIGCQKDPAQPNGLTLLRPGPDSVENLCCIHFGWETGLPGSLQLTMADSPTFAHPLLDTVTATKKFIYPLNIEPESTYYWRVKHGNSEKTSSFQIKDILAQFQGPCVVEIHKYFWGGAQGVDETFSDTTYITRAGQAASVNYPKENLLRTFHFHNPKACIRMRSEAHFGKIIRFFADEA